MSSIFCKELLNYQDKLFYIHRKLKESSVNPDYITALKDYWGCDMVLRQKNNNNESFLYYLVEIPEAEIIK